MTTPHPEMWRSKLGTNYSKEFMLEHETRLFQELQAVHQLAQNRACADCGAHGTVEASVNLGVFLCTKCGSHHRSLGTHISLPKNCTGSDWWGPDEIERMKKIGNKRASELYGSTIPNGIRQDDSLHWRQYLVEKYVDKKYKPTVSSPILLPKKTSLAFQGFGSLPLSPTRSPPPHHSPKSKKLPLPDMNLISFPSSPTSTTATQSPKAVSPKTPHHNTTSTGKDFFADFGL